MANESNNIYKPLNPNRDEVRILRLKSRQYNRDNLHDEQKIVCSLEHVTLHDAIDYTALSYVWENGLTHQEILVSDTERSISANLIDAFRHLRTDSADVLLWADQICINQEDHAEKASQIQKMGSIYKRARGVIAWLGDSADESEVALITLRQIDRHHTQSLKTSLLSAIAEESEQSSISVDPDRIWDAIEILDTLRIALPAFAARRYWRRLWVLQEYVLATNILIMWGSQTISASTLSNAWHLLGKAANNPDTLTQHQNSFTSDLLAIAATWRSDPQWWDAWLGIKRFTSQRSEYHSRPPPLGLQPTPPEADDHDLFTTILKTLTTFSGQISLACSDPRDRIFALLALATDSDEFTHFPNYTTPPSQTYEEMARNFVMQGYIDTLSFCQEDPTNRARGEMASWAADLSLKIRLPLWGKLPLCASHSFAVELNPTFPSPKTIEVSGTCIGTIRNCGSQWSSAQNKPLTRTQMQIFLRQLRGFCDSSARVGEGRGEEVCANVAAPVAAAYFLGNRELMVLHYWAIFVPPSTGSEMPEEEEEEEGEQEEFGSEYSSPYERELRLQTHRCPFVTTNGYVGIAPPYIREGDVVVIFPGAKMPYILRPQQGLGEGNGDGERKPTQTPPHTLHPSPKSTSLKHHLTFPPNKLHIIPTIRSNSPTRLPITTRHPHLTHNINRQRLFTITPQPVLRTDPFGRTPFIVLRAYEG